MHIFPTEVKVSEEDVRIEERSNETVESSEEILAKYRRHPDKKQRHSARRPSDVPDAELER